MVDAASAASGDRAARLYETYGGAVFATCMAMLRNREDAADATHEVFAKAFSLVEDMRHPCAWLQVAARHHCADLVRRRQLADRTGVPGWGGDRTRPDPADVVVQRSQIARAMASLTEREQRALAYLLLRDATVAEVATQMRLSYAATAQLLARARRRAAAMGGLSPVLAGSPPPL